MATSNDVMAIAKKYIGTKERPAGSNNVIFNTDYYGHAVSGADYPWCCAFVWDVFRMAGASKLFYGGKRTAACRKYESWALSAGLNVDSGEYGDVATMDFGKGYASHIGFIVKKNSDGSYQTIEGNTSLSSNDNGGAVMERTRSRAVIRYIFRPKYAKGDIKVTAEQFLKSVANVDRMAKQEGWKYGDSHSIPPCADKLCSCDRLPARALWDLGYTDQPKVPNSTSGMTVNNMESYLTKKGWKKITKEADLTAGDIIIMNKNGKPEHAFVLTAYNPKTGMCSKYDYGSDPRIHEKQPYKNVPLNQWPGNYTFGCGLRAPGDPDRLPTKGTACMIESAINKAYCIDINGASMDVKANAQIYKKNNTQAQQFVIQDVKDGYVRIVNKKSGLVLDVSGGKAQNGKNIWQYEWNGTKAQLWKMRMNADRTITFESAINNNYVLDVKSGKAANKQNLQLYKNNGTKAQRFVLINV